MRVEVRVFRPTDREAVVELWKDCDLVVPWNDPYKDIERKMTVQADLFLVGLADARLVATVMGGYEGHRGWMNYLAVAPDCRRRGIGRRLVREVEKRLKELGCPKINVLIRTANADVIEFYRRLDFSTDEVIGMGKRLEKD